MVAAAATPNCSTIDFEDQLGPVRNQGDHGFCFGYVSADMIGQRLGLGSENQLSAAHVSMSYYFENYLDPRNYSSSEERLQLLAEIKSKYSPSVSFQELAQDRRKALKNPTSKKSYQNFDGGFLEDAILNFNAVPHLCSEKVFPSNDLGNYLQHIETQAYERFSASICQNPETPMTQKSLKASLPNSTFLEVLYREPLPRCEKKTDQQKQTYLIPKVFGEQKGSNQSVLNGVNEGLEAGRIVGIGYHTNHIVPPKDRQKEDVHASTIIGRKYDEKTKACEYKLRNSWGPECDSYLKSPEVRCVHGGAIWISEATLKRSLIDATYIQ